MRLGMVLGLHPLKRTPHPADLKLGFPTMVSSCRIRSSELRTWHASPPCGMWHQDSKGVRCWVVRNPRTVCGLSKPGSLSAETAGSALLTPLCAPTCWPAANTGEPGYPVPSSLQQSFLPLPLQLPVSGRKPNQTGGKPP